MSKNLLLLAIIILLAAACKKGDAGPAGAKGETGAQGPKGDKGDKGDAGTANVTYSAWIKTASWIASATSTGWGKNTYYFDIANTKITQDIIDKGTVLVYAKFVADPDGSGIAKLLPSTYYNLGGAGTQYNFQTGLFLNKLRIICDVLPAGIPSTSNEVRYVIIPGGIKATALNPNDYRTVAAAFHLEY